MAKTSGGSFGGVIKLTGASEYKQSINSIVQNLTMLSSQLKLVEASYDKNDTSTESLTRKNDILSNKVYELTQKQKEQLNVLELVRKKISDNESEHQKLTQTLESEKNKLEELKSSGTATTEEIKKQEDAVKKATESLAENEAAQTTNITAYQTTQIELVKTQTELEKTKRELKDNTEAIDNNTEKVKTNESAVGKLKNRIEEQEKELQSLKTQYQNVALEQGKSSTEALDLEREINSLNNELNENKKSLKESEVKLQDYGKETKKAKKETSTFGDTLKAILTSKVISKGFDMIVSGIQKVVSAMADFVKKGVQNASDITEFMNVVDVVYGDSASEIEAFAIKAATSYGMTRQAALQYAGTMGAMLQSMGVTGEETLKMSTALAGLAGDMASFYNISQDEAWQKIRSGISGEIEPLKQLGINLSVANLEEFALSQGIKKTYEEMTQAEKATLRYNYLMNAAANAVGDFERTSGNFVNQQRIAKLQIENMATALGEQLLPSVNGVLTAFNQMLSGEVSIDEGIANITNIVVDLANKLIEQLPMIFNAGTTILNSLIQGLQAALPNLLPAVQQITSQLLNFIVANLPAVIDMGAQLLLALIDGLVSAIPSLVPAVVQAIITIVDNLINNVDQIINAARELMVGLYDGLVNSIPLIIQSIPQIISSIITQLLAAIPQIIACAIQLIGSMAKGIIAAIPQIIASIPLIILGITSGLKEGIVSMVSVGWDLMQGLWKGLWSGLQSLWDGIVRIGDTIVGWFKNIFGINSPSKVFADDIGNNMGLGIEKGFIDSMKGAKKEMANAIPTDFDIQTNVRANGGYNANSYDNLVSAFKEALKGVKVYMDSDEMGEFVTKTVTKVVYN